LSLTTDTIAGFTKDGMIAWNPPSNWAATDLGNPGSAGTSPMYWVRAKASGAGNPTVFYGTPSVMCSDFIRSRQAGVVQFRVANNGIIYAKSGTIGAADVAEIYPSAQSLEPGDLVSMDNLRRGYVKLSNTAYDQNLIGVVSTKPGLTLGGEIEGGSFGYPIALVGRVPVKISLENGPIKIGDPLTSASIPGVAMRATKAGKILGYALENYNPEPATPSTSLNPPLTSSNAETLGEKWSEIESTKDLVAQSPASTTIPSSTIEEIEKAQAEIDTLNTTTTKSLTSPSDPLTSPTEPLTSPNNPLISSTEPLTSSNNPLTSSNQPLNETTTSPEPIKKILAFVNLTYFTGNLTVQEKNGKLTEVQPLQPAQVPAYFSIDSNGYLIVQKMKVKELEVGQLKVGSPSVQDSSSSPTSTLATGITIYDRVTGQPYCLFVQNGILNTLPGECQQTLDLPSTTSTEPLTSSNNPLISSNLPLNETSTQPQIPTEATTTTETTTTQSATPPESTSTEATPTEATTTPTTNP
jgi:hypothetical protein